MDKAEGVTTFELEPYVVSRFGREDVPKVHHLFEECADFFQLIHADPRSEAAQIFDDVPPGKHCDDKLVFGISRSAGDDYLVALVELLRRHPTVEEWCLGLLLVVRPLRGVGLGTAITAAVTRLARSAGARAIHIVVHEQNPEALRFWLRQGFEVRDRLVQPATFGTNHVFRLVLPLPPPSGGPPTDASASVGA